MQNPAPPEQPPAVPQPAAAVSTGPSATLVYRAASAQRDELQSQIETLMKQRHGLLVELDDHNDVLGAATSGMQQRIVQIDVRIKELDDAIAAANVQVARAASVPGAVTTEPPPLNDGSRDELFATVGFGLLLAVMLPITIASSRRIWRKSATTVSEFPRELLERFGRLEQSAEATALEVERIGEGQRFVTRLLTDRADNAVREPVGARSREGS